jgi:hypothetical protein
MSMQTLHLTEQELSETLDRARQLAVAGESELAADVESYVRAAEEMGIPRAATIQAMRERNLLPSVAHQVGDWVFAPSVDEHWYPCRIVALEQATARLEFAAGGDHQCAIADLRPLALVPGKLVQVDYKDWGWSGSRVLGHDLKSGQVEVETSGSKGKYPLEKIRLSPRQANPPTPAEQKILPLNRAALMKCAAWAGGTGLIAGVLLAKFLAQLFPFLPFL